MQKFLIVAVGLIVGTTLGAYIIFYSNIGPFNQQESAVEEAVSEEPFHEHVDLRIVVNGQALDLSSYFFQSDSYNYRDQHFHLHDGNGKVAHLHKAGATLNDFLRSIDMELSDTCLSIGLLEIMDEDETKAENSAEEMDHHVDSDHSHGDHSHQAVSMDQDLEDRGTIFEALGLEDEVSDVPQINYCKDAEDTTLAVYVNGQQRLEMGSYALQDLDRVLVYYGVSDQEVINSEIENVTDKACIYSLVCPERGTPPEEACISTADGVCGA